MNYKYLHLIWTCIFPIIQSCTRILVNTLTQQFNRIFVPIVFCLSEFCMNIFILDVIKYCDHPRWYEKIPPGGGTSNQRWDLQLEVRSPIGGDTSNQRWHLQLEVGPPIGGEISNWRWDLQLKVTPPIGGGTLIRGGTSNWRHPCYM